MTSENQQSPYPHYDNGVSLVDLATTFVRRRRVFYAVFLLVMTAALALVFVRGQHPSVNYTTTIQLSVLPMLGNAESTGENRVILEDRIPTLLAKISSHWLPIAREQIEQKQADWPGTIRVEAVENTQLIRLISSGKNLSEENAREVHKLVAGLIVNAQNERLAGRLNLLEQQIQTMNRILEDRSPESLVAAQAIESRTDLQQIAATGEPASVLSLASKSGSNNRFSLKLVLALAVVLAGALAIFAVFMAEFGSQVRRVMKEKD